MDLVSYVVCFTALSLVSYQRVKQEGIHADISKHHSSLRTHKFLLMALMNTSLAAFGIYNTIAPFASHGLDSSKSLAQNLASLKSVFYISRSLLDTEYKEQAISLAFNRVFVPLFGFYLFGWFGLGAEARETYGEAFEEVIRLICTKRQERRPHVGLLPLSRSAIVLRKFRVQQNETDSLECLERKTD
jgi:hypothetical protein